MYRSIAGLLVLLLSAVQLVYAPSVRAARVAHFKKTIVVATGDVMERVYVDNGRVEIASGGKVGIVEVNNGTVAAALHSEVGSIRIHNGSLQVAGTVRERIFCGNGELHLLSGARIDGAIDNYRCRIRIDQGAVVAATIRNFDGRVDLGKAATIRGDLHFLRAADATDEIPSRILLELGKGASIDGALVTHYCVGIKLARKAVIAQQRGVSPRHIGRRRRASDPYRSCQPLPQPLNEADRSITAGRDTHLGFGVSLGEDSTQPVFIVDGGIRINSGITAGALETINGSVEMERSTHAASVRIVNGSIMMEKHARLDGDIAIANGDIFLDADARVLGSARTDVGSVFVSYRAKVTGTLGTTIGSIVLLPGAEIGALHFGKFADRELKGGFGSDTLHIHKGVRILGDIVFDRPITVYIAADVAMPKYHGVTPRIREADERLYTKDSLGYQKDRTCTANEKAGCERDKSK